MSDANGYVKSGGAHLYWNCIDLTSPSKSTSNHQARDPLIDPLISQDQAWRYRETSQVEVKGLKNAAFLKRETSMALASYHYETEGTLSVSRDILASPADPQSRRANK